MSQMQIPEARTGQTQRQQEYAGAQLEADARGVNRLSMDLWAPGGAAATLDRVSAFPALGAQLREQGTVLRQGARNLGDAQSLLSIAGQGMLQIGDTLGGMRSVVERVSSGTLSQPQASTLLDGMGGEIDAIVQNTRWQGIAPLDGASWGRQPSIPTVGSANGSAPVPLELEDQRKLFSGSAIRDRIDISSPDGRKQSDVLLTDLEARARKTGTTYSERASGYGSLSVALQSQADIMDAAVRSYASGLPTDSTMPTAESISQALAMQVSGGIVRQKA